MNAENAYRNRAIFREVMNGSPLRTVGLRYGISGMRVKQIVDNRLAKLGFGFSGVPGRHDLERARSIYKLGGLRHV